MAVDTDWLNAFMDGFVRDLGAVMHAATVVPGDRLGLYKALARRHTGSAAIGPRTGAGREG